MLGMYPVFNNIYILNAIMSLFKLLLFTRESVALIKWKGMSSIAQRAIWTSGLLHMISTIAVFFISLALISSIKI
jgi:hypothetical protein